MTDVGSISDIVKAGGTMAGALVTFVTFVWVRVEKIGRGARECERARQRDKVSGRERRATLLAMIDGLLAVIGRHNPGAPEIGETRQRLNEFRQRERLEAEQEQEQGQ